MTAKGGEERRARKRPREEGTYTQKQSRAGPKRGAQLAGNGQWRFCSVALAETCSAACRGLVRRYRCEEVKHLPPREGEVTELQHHGGREGGRWGGTKRLGELCGRIDAFGSELPPAIALQLCALAAVVGLRGFIARESTGTDFSLGGAKIISAVGSCYRDIISTEILIGTEKMAVFGLHHEVFFKKKRMYAWNTKRNLFVKIFSRMSVIFRDEFIEQSSIMIGYSGATVTAPNYPLIVRSKVSLVTATTIIP